MPFVVYKALKGLIRSLLALGGLFPSVLFFCPLFLSPSRF